MKSILRTISSRRPLVFRSPSWAATLHFQPCRRFTTDDTIYALSTPHGKAGIAVIRVSGPNSLDIYKSLCLSSAPPKPRHATVRTLYSPESKSQDPSGILDAAALVLHFPSPSTVTGEDVLEFHVHGSPATVKAVLAAIPRVSGRIRYADPGEFTRRAFFNGRLDLAQVESLSDVLDAETEQQRRAAVRGQSGNLGKAYDKWRLELLHARAQIEALIDFSEDHDFEEMPSEIISGVETLVGDILLGIKTNEHAGQRAELLRSGIRIALLGPPNVGKSSLMNLIVGREASIVSHEAGTTRDIVEASLDIRGYLCSFADMAGFRDMVLDDRVGDVEREGIRRARMRASESDVLVVMASVERIGGQCQIRYESETLDLAAKAQQSLVVINKQDLVSPEVFDLLADNFKNGLAVREGLGNTPVFSMSCRDGSEEGLHQLVDSLATAFSKITSLPIDRQDLLGVTARQTQLLGYCRGHLEAVMEHLNVTDDSKEGDVVLVAENLRIAADYLAHITGRNEDVEEVLGVIFEK